MIHIPHFIQHVIQPAIAVLGLDRDSRRIEELLLGTAIQESRLTYLHQLGRGPAEGLFQMEPTTHNDLYDNYLNYNSALRKRVLSLSIFGRGVPPAQEMCGNMLYAAAMCRVHYRRIPEGLPDAGDLEGQAGYWKQYYNTYLGSGTEEEYIENYQEATFRMTWPQ